MHKSISLEVRGAPVAVHIQKFPAGESLVRIDADVIDATYKDIEATLTVSFDSNDDLINMLLVTDALRRHCVRGVKIHLRMDYLPYARQDRVCNVGESLSVKVVTDLINAQGYASVSCKDIHSEVGVALIDRLIHRDQIELAKRLRVMASAALLVSPDAGANKKVFAFAKKYGFDAPIRADKTRDVATGAITGIQVFSEHVGDKALLIVDDICDGGRTFIELAKELRKITDGEIFLYVTHGLFTNGVGIFNGVIDQIYTSNMMAPSHPLVEVI